MGAYGGILPKAFARDADSAVCGGRGHGEDVELVAHGSIWLMVEKGFRGSLGIGEEDIRLRCGIAFGKDDDVYAVCGEPL